MSNHRRDSDAAVWLVLGVLALVVICLVSGCAPADPIAGTVTAKEYEPASSEYECAPDLDGKDIGSLDCAWEDEPECWSITVTDAAGVPHTWCTTEKEWSGYAIGAAYPRPADGASS